MRKITKTSKNILTGMVCLALVSSSFIYSPKAYASGEEELKLSLSSKANIDIVLTTNEIDVDMNKYQTALKDKLIEKGIENNRINITGVEGYKTQTALVLQDAEAWDSKEVVIDTLRSLGYTPEVKTSTQLGSLDLYRYSHIFITSDQPQTFYTILNQNMNRITDWISGGGILQFNAADKGWRNSFWTNGPAGIEHVSANDATNRVVIPNHAVTQGIPSTVTGNYASHSYLTNLPQDTIVYMSNSAGKPTVVEFNYGIGTIFAQTTTAEYYTTHSGNLAPLLRNTINYNIKKVLTKSFNDIIKQPKWREGSERFIVNVDDDKVSDFDNSKALGEILPRVINEEIHYVGLGTDTNKSQTNSFIQKINNEGAYFDNNNFENSINQTADYIISQLQEEETGDSQYVLVGEPIDIKVSPSSLATNTQTPQYPLGRWRIDHNYEYFENNLGQASWANQWQKDLQMVFDKPGQYDISFGDSHPNPRYVFAHRKPVASFANIVKNNGSTFGITIQDYSYDLDMESRSDKGIAEQEWKWKKTTDSEWTNGKIPSSLPIGNDYIVQLRVKDYQGAWSAPESRYITTASVVARPVANFTLGSNHISMYQTLDVSDTSYDPAGRNVTEKTWTIYKNNSQIYSGTTPLTNFRNYGIGEYRIALKVKNDAGLWSEEFSRNLTITDDTEKPEAIVNPTSQSWTSNNISVNVEFSDKGGSQFKYQRYVVNQSPTPPTSGWSAYSTSTSRNVTISQEGKNYLHIEGEDNVGNKFTRTIGEYQIDRTAPVVSHSLNPNSWTDDKVTVQLNATDNLSGIRSIELPNGNKVYGENSISYVVSENGDYSFNVIDNVGTVTTKKVTVSNIDRDKPNVTHSIEHVNGDNYKVTLTAEDNTSGVKQIKLPDGSITNQKQVTYNVVRNESYSFEIEDNAGNILQYPINVNVPELNVYQKDDHAKAEWSIDIGYTTKARLYRGDKMLYEGLLSEYEDKEATDKTKPNKISDIKVTSTNKNVIMNIQKPEDNGTEYDYTLKAVSNKGDTISSEKKKLTVTTGIDGYSYVIDKNATTVPDNTVDTRSETVQIPVTDNGKYYVHIKAIDKAGNVSDVSHIAFQDSIAPTLVLTQNPTSWTSSSVQITANATDKELDVKRIKLPNGTWINGDTATYSVSQNGTYTFVAEDLVGNQTTKSITISNIDTTAPSTPSIKNNQEWTKNTPVPVTIIAGTDSQSGVNRVEYKLEGATVKSWTTYNGEFNISNEGETKITARTVDNLGQLSAEVISYVRIDKSVPYNTGITIKLKP